MKRWEWLALAAAILYVAAFVIVLRVFGTKDSDSSACPRKWHEAQQVYVREMVDGEQ